MVRRGVYNVYIVHYNSKPMTKTRIIGHRGAAGLELENTLPSFKKAVAAGVRIIEFDVHSTLDNRLVVCHDNNIERVSGASKLIRTLTYEELQAIPLKNDSTIPLLSEVMDFARKHHLAVIVEVKAVGDLLGFCSLMDHYAGLDITIASFNHGALAEIKQLRPNLPIYLGEQHRPVAVLQEARAMKAQGVDLHYMLINPLTYLIARYYKLEIMLFTVNSHVIARFLMWLYPKVYICTNYPDKFALKSKAR